jgi:hypothetical protein
LCKVYRYPSIPAYARPCTRTRGYWQNVHNLHLVVFVRVVRGECTVNVAVCSSRKRRHSLARACSALAQRPSQAVKNKQVRTSARARRSLKCQPRAERPPATRNTSPANAPHMRETDPAAQRGPPPAPSKRRPPLRKSDARHFPRVTFPARYVPVTCTAPSQLYALGMPKRALSV